MARKHAKHFSQKAPVERKLITKGTTERKIVTNPTTGELEVVHITTPDIYKQGKATGQTTWGSEKNTSDQMAPKGKSGAAPLTRSKR